MGAKKQLGAGFNALFSENADLIDSMVTGEERPAFDTRLPISSISPNKEQARKTFEREPLEELAQSIAQHGVISPLIVKPSDGGYTIIAGERRWRAARMAGLTEVPVIIRDIDDVQAAQISLIENLQREDLNPIEEAAGYKQLGSQYNLTQEEISRAVGKSRSAIANSMRLLTLPDDVVGAVREGALSAGHAKALIPLGDEASALAKKIIEHDLNVRQTEKLVREFSKEPSPIKSKTDVELQIENLERTLEETLGRRSKIAYNSKGKGKITLEFYDNDDFEGLLSYLLNRQL